ncbi:FtsX-like permease family protein [Chryseolinea sp. H1M3-3]|uniref:ABC transporter permease n=1 Tax=Chryseolinea sp. H1M3-3 TaxID=3034144 RepID=UPI0023EDC171|nr:FtsX-like permease family protein [Chryseolinea sp. H1M3-3]
MFKNFLLITLRNMMKNKLFIFINVFGMGVAIACCIVAYFTYEYDATFNAGHKNGNQIYRVSAIREFDNNVSKFGFAPLPLGGIVDQNFKDVERSSRYFFSWSNFKREDDLFPSHLSYVDPDFFEMFSFEFIKGDPKGLKDISSVFIDDKMAVRLYGSPEEAFGKMITQVYGAALKEIKIAGIFKTPPQNSSFFSREAYMNFENCKDEHKDITDDNWKGEATLFLQIADPSRVASVHQQLQPYKENNNKAREDFIIKELALDPFSTMAKEDRAGQVDSWTWHAPPIAGVVGTATMGILILLIACFNLTNTAIAISSRRLKEIGIRKVMGGLRKQLIIQFIGETTLICFFALLVGLIVAEFLTEGWNNMWEYMRITPHYLDNPQFLIFIFGVLIFTGLLAGGYPAFYISNFEPISILKGKMKFGGTNYFTRILLGLQFAISLMAIVSAIAFLQNAKYQEAYDLGFDEKGSVIAWLNSKEEFETYRNSLQGNPEIISMAGAASGIFSNRAHEPVKHESKQVEVDIIDIGDHYLKTMNLTLLEGRDFRQDSETDKRESIIISQKMASLFGWEKPLGKEIIWKDTVKLYVVGVVKDVYTQGLWRAMEPLMIRYIGPEKYSQIVVNTKSSNASAINKYMEARWKEIFPNRLYNGYMLVENTNEVYEVNANIVTMYTFLGVIALMLSATGLFTLVSLNIIKRTKEIGVRKVLGASITNITRIINTEFFVILLLASAAGSVLSYFAVDLLMDSIWDYYRATNTLTFVISISVMFIVSALVVGYKVFSAASMNPVTTLRDE